MTVVFERPYQFVPPYRGDLWPTLIQRFRLIDLHLRKSECVVSHEVRYAERLKASLDRGDGILLAPNHCRYADPIVLGWLAREVDTHVFAVASWHLFNVSAFQSYALRRMGAFSINREGVDRESLETAIEILTTAMRPLIVFAEGTTNRTNDVLKPLLDGVTFIARTAARRRAKHGAGQVVIHPIGLKYLCRDGFTDWAEQQLAELEQRIGWRPPLGRTILQRTVRIAEAMLAVKEVEYLGRSGAGDLSQRRDVLMQATLDQAEQGLKIQPKSTDTVRDRVRRIRADAAQRYFQPTAGDPNRVELENVITATDLAQSLLSFPDCYLSRGQVTDTRIMETLQRVQETMFGQAADTMPLHAVIEVDHQIIVPAAKAPRGVVDPLLVELDARLHALLQRLSDEASPIDQ